MNCTAPFRFATVFIFLIGCQQGSDRIEHFARGIHKQGLFEHNFDESSGNPRSDPFSARTRLPDPPPPTSNLHDDNDDDDDDLSYCLYFTFDDHLITKY